MSKLWLLAFSFAGVFLLVVGYALYTYLHFYPVIQNQTKLLNYKDQGIVLVDRTGEPFYYVNNAKTDTYTHYEDIAPSLRLAVVAAEDREFYSHHGVSPRGILRSILLNLKEKSFAYGGSTITQQLVKNTLLSPNKNVLRKFQEIILAFQLEQKYSKSQILEMYLNSVYFGEGAIGVNEASMVYFGKKANKLSVPEAAYLAAMLKFPSQVSAYTGDRDLGLSYQQNVLAAMHTSGRIDDRAYENARDEKLVFRNESAKITNVFPHYAMLVVDELKKRYGDDVVYEGLTVKTPLDRELQMTAQKAVADGIAANTRNGVTNGALVSIVPQTGEVVAVVGSADWFDDKNGKLNMAVVPRQPGSSFKPIVYSLAFDEGLIQPSTILKDTPHTFVLQESCHREDCIYKPANYDKRFRGNVTVRRALANSLNVPAVEVMEKVGIDTLLSQAPQFGIHSLKDKTYYGKGLSLVLGSAEVSPLEMASAYSTFAANGKRPEPLFITEVRDKYGAILEKAHVKSTRVVSAESAYFINSILSDNAARSESFGSLLTIPYPAAVKTGTTDSYRDAWTVGYTPKLVTAVWVGNNDASYIKNVPGSLAAAPIWKKVMTYYSSTYGYENFSRPDSIVRAVMCVKNSSGSARLEYFIRGRQPKQNCQEQIAPNVASADKTQPQIGGGAPSPTPEAPTISPEPTTGQL